MKVTNALWAGTEPSFGLQTRQRDARPAAGPLQGGWENFYESSKSDGGRPHLHTYGTDSEKFFETFKLPYQPGRPAKPRPDTIGVPGQTWGIGGSLPSGTKTLLPRPAQEVPISSKRYLEPKPADDFVLESKLGRKKHVYDGAACHMNDRANRRSEVGFLEDALQRRGRVTEEMVSEKRTIHRMAPPGLKGYMGAEYANGYWMMDGVVPRTKMRMTREDAAMQELQKAAERTIARLGKPKSFKQKRAEEDLAEQVDLVGTLKIDYDYISDDEDVPPKVLATE